MSNIYRPESFQGFGRKENYFEGWYFKMVDGSEKKAFAVIPGISLSKDASKSHAFVMIFDARAHKMSYYKYSTGDFWADKRKFEIKIGNNFFTSDRLQLDCGDGSGTISADISMKGLKPWPVGFFSPGVMGWYRFVPFMECYHANVSFDNAVDGYISLNRRRERTDMSGGRGYIEKDWGSSMPQSWIWMQSNHFETPGVSLFGSVAKIPWLGGYFTGYIFGFLHGNRLYKFTTYNGAGLDKIEVSGDFIEIAALNRGYRLEIRASRTQGVDLPAPRSGEMTSRVNESLSSLIEVRLTIGEKVIFSGTGRNSGLEFVGGIGELLKGLKK